MSNSHQRKAIIMPLEFLKTSIKSVALLFITCATLFAIAKLGIYLRSQQMDFSENIHRTLNQENLFKITYKKASIEVFKDSIRYFNGKPVGKFYFCQIDFYNSHCTPPSLNLFSISDSDYCLDREPSISPMIGVDYEDDLIINIAAIENKFLNRIAFSNNGTIEFVKGVSSKELSLLKHQLEEERKASSQYRPEDLADFDTVIMEEEISNKIPGVPMLDLMDIKADSVTTENFRRFMTTKFYSDIDFPPGRIAAMIWLISFATSAIYALFSINNIKSSHPRTSPFFRRTHSIADFLSNLFAVFAANIKNTIKAFITYSNLLIVVAVYYLNRWGLLTHIQAITATAIAIAWLCSKNYYKRKYRN